MAGETQAWNSLAYLLFLSSIPSLLPKILFVFEKKNNPSHPQGLLCMIAAFHRELNECPLQARMLCSASLRGAISGLLAFREWPCSSWAQPNSYLHLHISLYFFLTWFIFWGENKSLDWTYVVLASLIFGQLLWGSTFYFVIYFNFSSDLKKNETLENNRK